MKSDSPALVTLRAVLRQGFLPIFGADAIPTPLQLEVCRRAGVRVIEYTQRRADAGEMIPRLCREGEFTVIAGSVLDDDGTVAALQGRFPQLRTVHQLVDAGVAGLISRTSFRRETISALRRTHLLAPCAGSVNEAFELFSAGAQLIKIVRPDYEVLKQLETTPLFGFAPVFITGGMNESALPAAMADGAAVAAAGFDILVPDCETLETEKYCATAAARLRRLMELARQGREARSPGITAALDAPDWPRRMPFAVREDFPPEACR